MLFCKNCICNKTGEGGGRQRETDRETERDRESKHIKERERERANISQRERANISEREREREQTYHTERERESEHLRVIYAQYKYVLHIIILSIIIYLTWCITMKCLFTRALYFVLTSIAWAQFGFCSTGKFALSHRGKPVSTKWCDPLYNP